MQRHVEGFEARNVAATAIDLPLRKAELAVPVYREHTAGATESPSALVISGQSYGGRVVLVPLVAGLSTSALVERLRGDGART